MNGTEFLKRAKKYAKRSGQDYRFEPGAGKGSHGRLYIGGEYTTVKRSEISPGLVVKMLAQLKIKKEDF